MMPARLAKKQLRQSIRRVLLGTPLESVNRQCKQRFGNQRGGLNAEGDILAQTIMNSLTSMPEYQAARRVSIYMSMASGEVATGSVVRDALQRGKHVYIPYTHKPLHASPNQPSLVMDMVTLHSLEDYAQLQPDIWGIPSPSEESIKVRRSCLQELVRRDPSSGTQDIGLDLIVVPGMAFDTNRGRLGHGKGFYDYFFQRYQESHRAELSEKATMPFLGWWARSKVEDSNADLTRDTVGLALEEQVLPEGQRVPTDASDWQLDCVLVGDGRVLRGQEKDPPN